MAIGQSRIRSGAEDGTCARPDGSSPGGQGCQIRGLEPQTSYAAWYARDSRRVSLRGRSQSGRHSENRERFALAAFNTLILTLRTAEHQGGSNGRAASKKVRLPQATRALRLCHASYKVAQRTSVQGAKCTPDKERFCRRETPCPPQQARANPTGLLASVRSRNSNRLLLSPVPGRPNSSRYHCRTSAHPEACRR